MNIPEFSPPTKNPQAKARARKPERRTTALSSSSGESESGEDAGSDDDMAETGRERRHGDGMIEEEMIQRIMLRTKGNTKRKSMDERHVRFKESEQYATHRGDDEAKGQNRGGQAAGDDAAKQDEEEDMCSSGEEDFGKVGEGEDQLYDPDMDDLDQQFVDNKRRKHIPGFSRAQKKEPKPPKAKFNDDGDDEDASVPNASTRDESGGIELGEEGSAETKECEWKAYLAPIGHEYYHNTKTEQYDKTGTTMSGQIISYLSIEVRVPAYTYKPRFTYGHMNNHNSLTGSPQGRSRGQNHPDSGETVRHSRGQGLGQTQSSVARAALLFYASIVSDMPASKINCNVDMNEELRPAKGIEGVVHPVRCATCEADVGVMDKDEVFHFFDVLPSNG